MQLPMFCLVSCALNLHCPLMLCSVFGICVHIYYYGYEKVYLLFSEGEIVA